MATMRIRPKRQVTIPKEIFDQLHLEIGDFIEARVEEGKIVMIPKKLVTKAEVISLSKEEQEILFRARRKIARIREDLLQSEGLSREEIEVATKVGLIDPEQAWWWTEEWQKGEREAEKEIREGEISSPFKDAAELISHLSKEK